MRGLSDPLFGNNGRLTGDFRSYLHKVLTAFIFTHQKPLVKYLKWVNKGVKVSGKEYIVITMKLILKW